MGTSNFCLDNSKKFRQLHLSVTWLKNRCTVLKIFKFLLMRKIKRKFELQLESNYV
jgi:hypothetical protein